MRLGNLIDTDTKRALQAMVVSTVVPWHKRPDAERMTTVCNHCDQHAQRIGLYLDKKGRSLCNEPFSGRRVMTDWIKAHASALTLEHPRWTPDQCMKHSMHDVLNFYGYQKPFGYLSHTFDTFELVRKPRESRPETTNN